MSIELSEEIRRNFHLFWDNYPAGVILAYRDRTILEVNKAAKEMGYPVGVRCIDLGEKKAHATCRLQSALKSKEGVRDVAYNESMGKVMDGFWIPLAGAEDIYVHFANDITEYASEKMFSSACEAEGACGSCSAS